MPDNGAPTPPPAPPSPPPEPPATGALGSEAQTQIRLTRIETRLDGLDKRLDHVISLLEGRTKLSEKCLDLLQAFVTGPNVKWLALVVLGLAAVANGMALSGYGITLGTITEAVVDSPSPKKKGKRAKAKAHKAPRDTGAP